MKLYILTPVIIHFEKERARVRKLFKGDDRQALLYCIDLVERGQITRAQKMTAKWSRDRREYLPEEIWDLLWASAVGKSVLIIPK